MVYVDSNADPSDVASRGLRPDSDKVGLWLKGPKILWEKIDFEIPSTA